MATATDVDHVGDRHDHSLANLQSLCGDHHKTKTAREGHEAMAKRRAQARHPAEPHPGLLAACTGGQDPDPPF